jgi:hypothetical protein
LKCAPKKILCSEEESQEREGERERVSLSVAFLLWSLSEEFEVVVE